jgi:hypothetical protein
MHLVPRHRSKWLLGRYKMATVSRMVEYRLGRRLDEGYIWVIRYHWESARRRQRWKGRGIQMICEIPSGFMDCSKQRICECTRLPSLLYLTSLTNFLGGCSGLSPQGEVLHRYHHLDQYGTYDWTRSVL